MATAAQIFPSEPEPQKPSIGERVKNWWQELRIGDGHAAAMGRAGFKELTQALVALPDSSIRPVEEQGVFGNPTAQIVTQEMGKGYQDMLDQASSRAVRGDDRGMER